MKDQRSIRLVALASLSLAIAACDAEPAPSENVGEAESELKVCPGAKTVRGIDVSEYQETIDWNQVAASGIKFAIARKSYGTGHIDATFPANWDGMKAAGIVRGAYQWVRPGQDIQAQADIMINAVGKLGPGDLPAMADIEEAGTLTKAAYAAKVQQWLDLVEQGTGKRPMIYTGSYFWDANVASNNFQSYPLIDAAYIGPCYSSSSSFVAANDCWKANCPTISNAFDDWQFWQYSSQTHVPGISQFDYVDMDLFNGDEVALNLLAGSAYAAEVVSIDVPTTMGVGQTALAHITYKNTGVATWDVDTKIGTTGPRDRMSAFAAPDWEAANRASHVAGTVAPGDTYTFDVALLAPSQVGSYTEPFGLVEESVAWFADQGGPTDDAVTVKIDVVETPQTTTSATGTPATSSTSGTGGGGGTGGDGASGDLHGSCSCNFATAERRASDGLALGLIGLVSIVLRRRTRR